MGFRNLLWMISIFIILSSYSSAQHINDVDSSGYSDLPPSENHGWLDTAKRALSGPAGKVVVAVAKEMISRSAGNSQILSLNLTNLLILVLLKALIFAAGLVGAGNWSHYARARNINHDMYGETALLIGYLTSQGTGEDGCLARAACKAPDTASDYLRAATAIYKGIEMFEPKITYHTHYGGTIDIMQNAIVDGMRGAACDTLYTCIK